MWRHQPRQNCMVGTTTRRTTAIPGTKIWQKAQARKMQLDARRKTDYPTTQYANTRNTRTRCPYFEPKRHETWALQNGNITKIRDNDARTRAEKKLETGTSIKSISHPDYRTTDEHICTKAPGKRSHYAKEQKRQFAVTIFTILFLQNYHYHNAFSISCLSIQKFQS